MNYSEIILTILIFLVIIVIVLFIYNRNKVSTFIKDDILTREQMSNLVAEKQMINDKKGAGGISGADAMLGVVPTNATATSSSDMASQESASATYDKYVNIPYKIHQEATVAGMSPYGELPQFKSTGCPDIRGRPAPIIDMLKSSENINNPLSLTTSAAASHLGTLYSSYGLCNQERTDSAIDTVSLKHQVPNKLWMDSYAKKFMYPISTHNRNQERINAGKANILFRHIHRHGHYK